MKILFDANVVLDVLLNRDPWVRASKRLWQAIEDGKIEGCLVASTLTDIFYIVRRASAIETARQSIGICIQTFIILPVDRTVVEHAYHIASNDFEDNVQIACAELFNVEGIVTRDPKGFSSSKVSVWQPADLVKQLGLEEI